MLCVKMIVLKGIIMIIIIILFVLFVVKQNVLEDFVIPSVRLPKEYLANNVEIVVNGICSAAGKSKPPRGNVGT
jgi:hypothetical protein